MPAALKQLLTLVAGNMAGSNNKASFIVKTLRGTYVLSGTAIVAIWYSAWRNERVEPGTVSFPFPGVKKLSRKFSPDRAEKELTHTPAPSESWGSSQGQIPKGVGIKQVMQGPSPFGIPQTAQQARAMQGVVRFEGKLVAAWIAPFLTYAKQHGWTGSLTQGFRTYAEEVAIWNSGTRPAAKPGTSNHGKKNFPGGAADVTEPQQLAHILAQLPGGSLLKWAGAKDEVHFSFPHNGGY
jgi:hypothetical protein